jgi:hypothetical protein
MIAMRQDLADQPAIQSILPSIDRALVRPQGRGFVTALLRGMKEIEVRTRAGLVIGHAPAYNVDLALLDSVVRRTLLGLFFHHTGCRVPASHAAVVRSLDGFNDLRGKGAAHVELLFNAAVSGGHTSIGTGVFDYWYQPVQGDEFVTVWLFVFYERVAFVGFTGRTADLQRNS